MKKGIFAFIGFLALFMAIEIFSFSRAAETLSTSEKETRVENFVTAIEIPKDLIFAGEKVPTELFDVTERMDRELTVNTYWQSQTLLLYKRANRWFPVIEQILKKNNIPDDFKYLSIAESGLLNIVSPAGATGFWQFLTAPGKQFGLEIGTEVDERYHVERATEAACNYLNEAYREFGNWALAAASYNMGIEGLKKQMEKQRAKNYYDLLLNDETSRYVFRLVAMKEVFSNPSKYGFKIRKKDLYPPIPFSTITVDSSIPDLVLFAEEHHINYKVLKLFNPWLRQYTLTNPLKKKYLIKIPDKEFNYEKYMKNQASADTL